MDIEGGALSSRTCLAKCSTNDGKGKQSKVSAAGGRDRIIEEARRGERKFRERSRRAMNDVRGTRRGWIPVSPATNWEKAGVVAVAFLDKNVECPLTTRNNREAWRAIAQHGLADQILEGAF